MQSKETFAEQQSPPKMTLRNLDGFNFRGTLEQVHPHFRNRWLSDYKSPPFQLDRSSVSTRTLLSRCSHRQRTSSLTLPEDPSDRTLITGNIKNIREKAAVLKPR